ncbi:MAG: choice-of-anchor D domain-containing protein [Deltaproteobacteria bacterium]|nr:choice-of-anchor D domain-containing protein [Deltaproteobacteria bacterium]
MRFKNFTIICVILTIYSCSCEDETVLSTISPDIKVVDETKTKEVTELAFGKVAKLFKKDVTIYILNTVQKSRDLEINEINFVDGKKNPAPPYLFKVDRTSLKVANGKPEAVVVSFIPADIVIYKYFLLIKSNAQTISKRELMIPISGEGMLPKMSIDKREIDFGNVWVQSTQTQNFVVSNWNGTGAGPLSIFKFDFSNSPESFSITEPDTRNLPIIVNPGNSLTVTVSFVPQEIRDYASVLTIHTDDPENREAKINLKGRGIEQPKNEPPIAKIYAKVKGEWVECNEKQPVQLAVPGEIEFSGKFSIDPNNDPIVGFIWNIAKDENNKEIIPEGSDYCFDCAMGRNTHFKESRKEVTKFFGDIVGDYKVRLIVKDATFLESNPSFCPIKGYAAQALHIELRWNTPLTDLDLHLINLSAISYEPKGSDGTFSCPCDCYTGNRNPDWGIPIPYKNVCTSDDANSLGDIEESPIDTGNKDQCCSNPTGNTCDPECIPNYGVDAVCISSNDAGESVLTKDPACYKGGSRCVLTCEPDESDPNYQKAIEDNPTLDIDDVEGFGPENINIISPSAGTYRVVVYYFNDQGIGSSDAWVKLYINGINKPEWNFGPFTLNRSKQAWDVVDIQWPESGSGNAVKITPLRPWTLRSISKCIGCTCKLR